MRLTLCSLVATLAALAALALWPQGREPRSSDLKAVAAHWVGVGTAQPPRRDGREWEVDVTRPDGSLVEVTLDGERRLLGLDEERGPGFAPAPDELAGVVRARATRAALAAGGPGNVLSVERDDGGVIEVGVRRADGNQVEVALDRRLRVLEVEPEDPADE